MKSFGVWEALVSSSISSALSSTSQRSPSKEDWKIWCSQVAMARAFNPSSKEAGSKLISGFKTSPVYRVKPIWPRLHRETLLFAGQGEKNLGQLFRNRQT